MARYRNYITVAWVKPNLNGFVRQCERYSGADVTIDKSYGLFGRTAYVTATGTNEQVLEFKRLFESAQ